MHSLGCAMYYYWSPENLSNNLTKYVLKFGNYDKSYRSIQ